MTNKEIQLIQSHDVETPLRVLLVDDESDLLFLRTPSSHISNVKGIASDPLLQSFLQRLEVTMKANSGIGIAAPQVGIGRAIFLFTRIDKPDYPVQVAINPRIVNHSEALISFEGDGCLSIPGRNGNTCRYQWVEVEYYDEKGNQIREMLEGDSREGDFTGVIFQHEYDHLQGILFIDRLEP